MKLGFYSPYLDTFGGGERYLLTLASNLSKNHDVDVFWNDNTIKAPLTRFLKIDLAKISFVKNIFSLNFYQKLLISRDYDLIFVLSDGSIPTTLSKNNILHFQVPFILNKPSLITRIKLSRYKWVIANSNFTKNFIDRSFGISSDINRAGQKRRSEVLKKTQKIHKRFCYQNYRKCICWRVTTYLFKNLHLLARYGFFRRGG